MKCPHCRSEVSEDSQFCSKCGTRVSSAGGSGSPATRTMRPSKLDTLVGTTLASKYRIEGEIGRGGMGVVYRAQDTTLKRTVALKFLPPEFAADLETRERFVIEAQAAAALSHPNICTIYEVGEADELSFIAMEFVEGQSLKQKIKTEPLKVEEAADIAVQVAAGLGEAHKKGIIHRDIKSANIMVTDKGQAKVMDFGLAKLRGGSSLTKTQTTLGTVAYMSPEQARGETVDGRTDLWSLGVVLYEMLTAELPFKGDRDASVIYSIVHEEPKSLKLRKPPVPEDLQKVMARALKKNREARYGSAEDLLKDLRAYQTSVQLAESGVLNLKRLAKRVRRPQVAVPTVVILAVLAFLGVRFFKHQAQVRWARQVALPQIEKRLEENNVWRDLIPVYHLAEKAEAIIPKDPKLAGIFSRCSLQIDINSEPPGARVFLKDYTSPTGAWTYLGVTPIKKIRLPIGVFRWKFDKDSYETVLAAASTWNGDLAKPEIIIPNDLFRTLDKKDKCPQGMTRVTGTETKAGKLGDFFIDIYEVTNRQYKEFINAGGYHNRKFLKEPLVRDGKEVGWEDALKIFVDQTGLPGPSLWQGGDYPEGQGDCPVSGISWYEAAAYAAFAGKSLPTGEHWGMARGEYTTLIQIPQLGGFALLAPFSNFLGKGPVPVGSLPGISAYGAYDMAGNVREWCSNEMPQGRLIRGGAFGDNTYMFDSWSQAPAMDRSAKNGFRCALYLEPEKIPAAAFRKAAYQGFLGDLEGIFKRKPVDDSIFRIYKDEFGYDRTDLRARVESRKESPDWVLEKVSYEAAYGGERVLAWLFLPRNTTPPYQALIYWGGDVPVTQRSSQDIENYYETPMFFSFLVKNGRAVLYPLYKGFFERGDDALTSIIEGDMSSHQRRDVLIQEVKDLRRSFDYLETRPDIDSRKVGFYAMSWGSELAPITLAVEERFRVSVLLAGGMDYGPTGHLLPDVDQLNYAPRVKIPTLMLNGRYDSILPVETSQRPMFNLLGTPPERKVWKLYDTDHIPPVNEFIKETLAWLDKYLGPVKR